MSTPLTETEFLRDVTDHVMEVHHDEGVYRHIRFRKPGTMCMHFDLITWPGYLCYTGDMGTYVFTRLVDMFEFFRTDRSYASRAGRRLAVNLSYWSEKLEAVDGSRRGGSAEEFDAARFRKVVNEYRLDWIRGDARTLLSKDERRELWEAVASDVLDRADDGEQVAFQAANDFDWKPSRYPAWTRRRWRFEDFWDHSFTDYTHRFRWCCFALAWGIEQYDLQTARKEIAA
ncbi:hypothetical protein [Achromobacter dolens]|uniref:hypothetical protein n=1 Tax=Achromobacter dolens TaxID=1287738 RepID=UPI000ADF6C5A|nr:hypothetical protein [Achromobacter dolens]